MLGQSAIKLDKSRLLAMVNSKKILIWGSEEEGRSVALFLTESGMKYEAFVDSPSIEQPTYLFDHPIFSPEYLKGKCQSHYVIIATSFIDKEIMETLGVYGFLPEVGFYNINASSSIVIEPIQEYQDQHNNSVIGSPQASRNSKIIFQGKNNKIIFEEGVILENVTITFLGDEGYCMIGRNSIYKGVITIGFNCNVIIGEKLTVTSNCLIITEEASEVRVGDDCMFATNNQIISSDLHPIFDNHSVERINLSNSVFIGNHVWLGYDAKVIKGASVQEGSIIGHSSIVMTTIPNNCIAVGSPARVAKRNVAWDRTNLSQHKHFSSETLIDKTYWNITKEL